MKRAIALLVACGCGTSAAYAPANACPGRDDLADQLAQPVQLDLRILDNFHWGTSCAGTQPHVVRVTIDQQPWCETSIPCAATVVAPTRSYACTGKPIKSGAHTLGVELDAQPASLMLRRMSLPAFDWTQGGWLVLGAHVRISVDEQRIIIDPPTASPQMMM